MRRGHPGRPLRVHKPAHDGIPKLTGSGPSGPLQRRVLRVLEAADRLYFDRKLRRRVKIVEPRPTGSPEYIHTTRIEGLYPHEIARVLSEFGKTDILTSSVQAAISGMYACDGRYWIDHLAGKRIRINKNGQAWLLKLDLL